MVLTSIIWFFIALLSACVENNEFRGSVNPDSFGDVVPEEEVDPPENIHGMYLNCQVIPELERPTEKIVGCNAMASKGEKADLSAIAKEWKWGFEENPAILIELIATDEADWHAKYKVNQFREFEAQMQAELDIVFKNNTTANILEHIDLLVSGLSYKPMVRVVVSSLHSHNPEYPMITYDKIEFKLNGVWHEIKPDLSPGSVIGLSDYEVNISGASFSDLIMFFNLMTGREPEINNGSSYSKAAPYNAEDEPVFFTIDFGDDDVRVEGIRYNGGQSFKAENMPTGSFDIYSFEYSMDGDVWVPIPGTEINLEKNPLFIEEYTLTIY